MQINRSKKFKNEFREIILFIAQDKKTSAKDFKNSINKVMDNLIKFPYKYRRSIYFNDKNIRDMVFRGYTNQLKTRLKPRFQNSEVRLQPCQKNCKPNRKQGFNLAL